jgi:hypothetical protein
MIPASEDDDTKTKVTFSGSNFFEGRYGLKPRNHGFYEEYDFLRDGEYRIQPWYYIKDIFDMHIGINNFYYRGRFLVDEPSMGFHLEDTYWYRELFAQRTFGYASDILNIEVGHFKTDFGRGITLSLKEDPLVELSNLLDGVHLMSELDFGTIKAFAGRNLGEENQNLDFLEDYEIRDNIFGTHIELFPFSYLPFLDFMSASSIGGGILNFRTGVAEQELYIDEDTIINGTDTLFEYDSVYIQPRENIILPTWLVNLSIGEVNVYGELARGYTRAYGYIDSLDREDTLSQKKSYSGFLELSGAVGDFYIRGEYKNYFYDYVKGVGVETNSNTGTTLSKYTDPPWARLKHLWHLLAKRTLLPHIQDELGYNLEITWAPSDDL